MKTATHALMILGICTAQTIDDSVSDITHCAFGCLCCHQGRFLSCVLYAMLMSKFSLVGSDAGWLGLMIAEERVDMFAAVHNAMLQVLKVSTTDAQTQASHTFSCKVP